MKARRLIALCALACFGCKDKTGERAPAADEQPTKPTAAPFDATAAAVDARGAPAESYGSALKRGRMLLNKDRAPQAASAFEAALRARPGDPMALSELSWARFRAGHMKRARKAANESIDNAEGDPVIKAASLYNLGRVQESEGQKQEAVRSYQRSYELRQHPVVAKRLKALGATVPVSVWTSNATKGPYKDLEDYCKQLGIKGRDRLSDTEDYCLPEVRELDVKLDGISWTTSVGTITTSKRAYYLPIEHLVFETKQGYYVLPKFEHRSKHYFWKVTRTQVHSDRLLITVANREGRYETWNGVATTVCGVGKSAKPSCIGPLTMRRSFRGIKGDPKGEHEQLAEDVSHHCSARLTAANELRIRAHDRGCRQKAGYAGAHRLRFR